MGEAVVLGVPVAPAVVDDGVHHRPWVEEVEWCYWMDLELAARLDESLVRWHEVVPFVVRLVQLAQEQEQE